MLMLFIFVVAFVAGLASSWLTARLSRYVTLLQNKVAAIPLIAILVFVMTMATNFILEAFRYQGACSGWQENGSHPCDFWEFVFQDWEMSLVFSLLPTLLGVVVGSLAFSASRSK
jgi:hypothetical protein